MEVVDFYKEKHERERQRQWDICLCGWVTAFTFGLNTSHKRRMRRQIWMEEEGKNYVVNLLLKGNNFVLYFVNKEECSIFFIYYIMFAWHIKSMHVQYIEFVLCKNTWHVF